VDDFDVDALYAALDEQRRARGLSWQGAAREISGAFALTPARPVSGSTLSGMLKRRVIEGDGVLQMLRWLDRAPESFVPGNGGGAPLPRVPADKILRFDTRAIYASLDARRRERGLTWAQVANEIGGLRPAALTRLANRGRTAFPDVIRVARWLGRSVASLTWVTRR
jgi:hypothetical protein